MPKHLTEPIIDIGCGESPDERANITADIRPVADEQFNAGADEWPWQSDYANRIILNHIAEHLTTPELEHAAREAARVLKSYGVLEITVPFGVNYREDADHEHHWTWNTPEILSRDHNRGWDPDPPLRLHGREVSGWFVRPFSVFNPLYRLATTLTGGGAWSTELPLTGGELTAYYSVMDE